MARPEQIYWDSIGSLEVHDGTENITLCIKAYPIRGNDDAAWDDDAFAVSLRPVWPILEHVLEVLGGQKASVVSRTRVKEVEGLREARRIVAKTDRIGSRVWTGFHCDIEIFEERDIPDGVLDLHIFLYSDTPVKDEHRRISSEKKLALPSLMPELVKPVISLFEVLAGARAPTVRLYGPEWHDEDGRWYGTDQCSLQAVWHDEERRVPDGPPNLIPFPKKA